VRALAGGAAGAEAQRGRVGAAVQHRRGGTGHAVPRGGCRGEGCGGGADAILAAELAPSIRVNAIAPTLTDTPLAARLLGSDDKRSAAEARHPLKRVGDPREMAKTGAWLLCGTRLGDRAGDRRGRGAVRVRLL
jgi:hypothetical protein